jgi:hypothetical protein
MHSLAITPERKQKEWTIIQYITQTNKFPHILIQKLNSQLQHRHNNYDGSNNTVSDTKTWTTFTYYSPLIRKITSLFKHANVRISVKHTNAIHDLTKPKMNSNIREHKKCGIYKLKCNTFKLSYIRQTSRNLKQRYQEHIRYIKQNYALHVLNNNHEYGPINTTTSFLTQITKTPLLIPYEQHYIQSHYSHKELIPEQNTGENNPLYQLIFDPRIMPPSAIYTDQYFDTTNTLFYLQDCFY